MTVQAATEVMQSQTKECWQPPETGRGKIQILLQSLQREHGSADTFYFGPVKLISDLWLLEYEEINFSCFKQLSLC